MIRDTFSDSKLYHLPQLRDTLLMTHHFQALFERDYPYRAITVEDCTLVKLDYRPQERCRALFKLSIREGRSCPSENWFYAKMYAPSIGWSKFEKARDDAKPFVGGWRTVSFLPEIDAVVYAFPYDPKLPYLEKLFDLEMVRQQVEENAETFGLPAGSRCQEVEIQKVKYRPGERCVLRFDVTVETPSGRQAGCQFFSKTYSNDTSRYVFDMLQNTHAPAAGFGDCLETPRPLLHLDGLHTYWQAAWNGRSMVSLYDQPDWQMTLPRLAAALATLHRSHISGLETAEYSLDIGKEAAENAAWIAQFLPNEAERILDVARRIQECDPTISLRPEVPIVPIHGAFRVSQLLGQGNRLALVDLDDVALGDPHFDVAEFMTSILYQHFRRDLPLEQLREKADRLRIAYAAWVPWPCDQRRLSWYIAVFLLEKLYDSLKNFQQQVLPKIDQFYDLIDEYLQLQFCRQDVDRVAGIDAVVEQVLTRI